MSSKNIITAGFVNTPVEREDITPGGITAKDINDITSSLRTDVEVLRERINGLDMRINHEMTTREKIVDSTRSDTHWKIGLCVTIGIAILGILFK
ncbi:hypothetical protein KQH98_09945 [Lactococcus lactis]|uniref:hypothetical protein n=1 Tax=Lactococcus lactis TaxID=1358 RepID=UPI001C0FD0AC|nr:hypothetical protein [Lactococcus lactis]MBU5243603.1 hypothetical protein [Lactococcus lactis]